MQLNSALYFKASMQKSLLTHIASNFISEYENVANSSVAYLLNEYSSARKALKNILEFSEVPQYYQTELATKNNGRPDITGLNINGEKDIIIEGKFWANLTENQPTNYLKEISKNGKLLFLAPKQRLTSLKAEIDKKLSNNSDKVIVCSWLYFLEAIELENNKNHNHHLNSDLIQLKELCQKMDSEGMPPLSESDLDPMNGKRFYHFANIIDECNPILREWQHANFIRLKTTSSKYGHGFYFYGYDFGCYLVLDSEKWFTHDSHTPIWLYVMDNNFKESERINHYLKEYDFINSFDSYYGINLFAGHDKNQTINDIIQKTKTVLTYLNEKIT